MYPTAESADLRDRSSPSRWRRFELSTTSTRSRCSSSTGAAAALNYLRGVRELRKTMARNRFDVVHAHHGLAGAVAVTQSQVPVVITFHGSDLSYYDWQRWVSRLAAYRAAVNVCVSAAGRRRFARAPLTSPAGSTSSVLRLSTAPRLAGGSRFRTARSHCFFPARGASPEGLFAFRGSAGRPPVPEAMGARAPPRERRQGHRAGASRSRRRPRDDLGLGGVSRLDHGGARRGSSDRGDGRR